jgi:hypothetical protein
LDVDMSHKSVSSLSFSIWELSAEKNIWTWERSSNKRLQEILHWGAS